MIEEDIKSVFERFESMTVKILEYKVVEAKLKRQ